jgi:flagellar FliJ protein
MATFRFRFQTLLKLRLAERQRTMSELAEAFWAETLLRGQRRELALEQETARQQLRLAASPGIVDVDRLLQLDRHEFLLEAQQLLLERRNAELQAEIQRRQAALAEADRQVQVLEKLCERQRALHCHEELRQDQIRIDEVAQRLPERKAT